MIFIRQHGNQIAEHVRRRRKSVQKQNGGSIPGTGFAIEDFQPLHFKRAIENSRRNRVRHLNSPSAREMHLRGRKAISNSPGMHAQALAANLLFAFCDPRMIVFPVIRSVELKAATASSRAATLPMFVRRRPFWARRTTSLNWARSGTTTKSI